VKVFISLLFISIFIFTSCSGLQENREATLTHSNFIVDRNITKSSKNSLEESEVIVNVFNDELYFEKDKATTDKIKLVIKYVDASNVEKKALKKIYKKHQKIWSSKQYRDLKKIIENDKYLSLCSDRKYWDNLEFEEEEPQKDVLKSILFLRYIKNLAYGCSQWVKSDGKIKQENLKNNLNINNILSLLVHEVLIDKLLLQYVPKEKRFFKLLEEYNMFANKEVIKEHRLEIEQYKELEVHPDYK